MSPQLASHSGRGKSPPQQRPCPHRPSCRALLLRAGLFLCLCLCAPQGRHTTAASLPVEEPWRWPSLALSRVHACSLSRGCASSSPGQLLSLVTVSHLQGQLLTCKDRPRVSHCK